MLKSLKVDVEVERRAKEEALSSKASIQDKSTTFIQEQQKEIEKLHKEKVHVPSSVQFVYYLSGA